MAADAALNAPVMLADAALNAPAMVADAALNAPLNAPLTAEIAPFRLADTRAMPVSSMIRKPNARVKSATAKYAELMLCTPIFSPVGAKMLL
jgi:hypothetical protein